jgi:hypothetical protein
MQIDDAQETGFAEKMFLSKPPHFTAPLGLIAEIVAITSQQG